MEEITGKAQEEKVEEKKEEQLPAGDQTPSKKEEPKPEVKPEVKPEEVKPEEEKPKVPISVQQRIDRMYARMKGAEERADTAEQKLAAQKMISGEEIPEEKPSLTQTDVEVIIAQKDLQKRFRDVETQVLLRHPEALDENGNFNMDDLFTQKYLEIGRKNPQLGFAEEGPLLAEAMAEKELGLDYKKGREDEATRTQRGEDAGTLSSTTKPAKTTKIDLSDAEKHAAARMGITDAEYAAGKEKLKGNLVVKK